MLAVLIVCGAAQLTVAQPQSTHPRGRLGGLLPPPPHARPAPPNPLHTPQVFLDATTLGSPVTLDKYWRVGITANGAAVRPDFDDSTWAVRNATEAIADVPDEDHPDNGPPGPNASPDHAVHEHGQPPDHQHPWVWFRLHIKLAPGHGPIALLVQLPISRTSAISLGSAGPGLDIFADGKQIQPDGPHGDDPYRYQSISRIYKFNVPPSETSLTLVARTIYIPFGYATYTAFFANRTFILGNPDDLNRSLELWWNRSLFERLPRLVVSILLAILAIFLFALYFTQKGHKEYLWLALHELAQAPLGFLEVAGSTAQIDQLLYGALFLELIVISAYLYFEFLVAFLDLPQRWSPRKRRWIIQPLRIVALPMLAGIGPTVMLVGHGRTLVAILLVIVLLITVVWFIGWLLFCFITLIAATARRNFEAGMLLFPLILTFIGIVEPMLTSGGMNDWTGHTFRSPLTIQAGPIPIHFASIADLVGLLAIVLIIFFRFLRIHRDQERVSSELAAARSVQELMIPQEKIKTPGFEVDSIYNPANEVGGDFFHVESTLDGGLLVVIGDVAGKGLKAAMNVSMVMGALRRITDHNPAKILNSLNRVLVGGDSFTTCQAAWFGPNGELVIANAGHLPPYLNTQEVELPGGLPLGVLSSVHYDEVRLYLHPGDRLLLMSDGVVEARQPSGELFGFERVHNLSNQTAFYIADAARSFGQEDDITVLTVRRLAQAMAA